MSMTLTGNPAILTGWGRTDPSTAQLILPTAIKQIQSVVSSVSTASLIARGLGRAYGNPAQCADGTVLDLLGSTDPARCRQRFSHMWRGCQPQCGAASDHPVGFFLPVTPGTRNVTMGGASLPTCTARTTTAKQLLITWVVEAGGWHGELRLLSPGNPATAEACGTAGSMGLTGVIVGMLPSHSDQQFADRCGYHSLPRADALMAAMVGSMLATATAWPGWTVSTRLVGVCSPVAIRRI